jgi:hypothetical protein
MILNKAKILPALRKAAKQALRQTAAFQKNTMFVQSKQGFFFSTVKS